MGTTAAAHTERERLTRPAPAIEQDQECWQREDCLRVGGDGGPGRQAGAPQRTLPRQIAQSQRRRHHAERGDEAVVFDVPEPQLTRPKRHQTDHEQHAPGRPKAQMPAALQNGRHIDHARDHAHHGDRHVRSQAQGAQPVRQGVPGQSVQRLLPDIRIGLQRLCGKQMQLQEGIASVGFLPEQPEEDTAQRNERPGRQPRRPAAPGAGQPRLWRRQRHDDDRQGQPKPHRPTHPAQIVPHPEPRRRPDRRTGRSPRRLGRPEKKPPLPSAFATRSIPPTQTRRAHWLYKAAKRTPSRSNRAISGLPAAHSSWIAYSGIVSLNVVCRRSINA